MADTGFDELRELADAAGDKMSLAMGMSGWVASLIVHARFEEASRWAFELVSLLESIGDPTLLLGLAYPALPAKLQTGEIGHCLQVAQRMIDLADGDPTKAISSSNRRWWRRSCCAGVDGVASRTHDGEATSRRHRRWPAHSMRGRAR